MRTSSRIVVFVAAALALAGLGLPALVEAQREYTPIKVIRVPTVARTSSGPRPQPRVVVKAKLSDEDILWNQIRNSDDPKPLKDYMTKFGESGKYFKIAERLTETLETERARKIANGSTDSDAKLVQTELEFNQFQTVSIDDLGNLKDPKIGEAEVLALELAEGVYMELVKVPAGKFTMGSPEDEVGRDKNEKQHEVNVPAFYMGRFEITQAQWEFIAKQPKIAIDLPENPSYFNRARLQGLKDTETLPVENITWNQAVEFCKRVARATGKKFRLPTEAEWEYACRAGSSTTFSFGNALNTRVANVNGQFPYGKSKKTPTVGRTVPVGSLGIANAFGLFDMHGNVWEWCQDAFTEDYANAPNNGRPYDVPGAIYRVRRGGYCIFKPEICRAAMRGRAEPDAKGTCATCISFTGMRIAISGTDMVMAEDEK